MDDFKIIIDGGFLVSKSLIDKYNIDVLSCSDTFSIYQKFDEYKDSHVFFLTSSFESNSSYITAKEVANKYKFDNVNVIDIKNLRLGMNLIIDYIMNYEYENFNPYLINRKINMLSSRLDTKFISDSNKDLARILGSKINVSNFVSGRVSVGNVQTYNINHTLDYTLNYLFDVFGKNIEKYDDKTLYARFSCNISDLANEKLQQLKYFKNILFFVDNKLKGNSLCLSMIKK